MSSVVVSSVPVVDHIDGVDVHESYTPRIKHSSVVDRLSRLSGVSTSLVNHILTDTYRVVLSLVEDGRSFFLTDDLWFRVHRRKSGATAFSVSGIQPAGFLHHRVASTLGISSAVVESVLSYLPAVILTGVSQGFPVQVYGLGIFFPSKRTGRPRFKYGLRFVDVCQKQELGFRAVFRPDVLEQYHFSVDEGGD